MPIPGPVIAHENKIVDDFVRGKNSTIVEHLNSYDFDVGMSLGFAFE